MSETPKKQSYQGVGSERVEGVEKHSLDDTTPICPIPAKRSRVSETRRADCIQLVMP